MKQGGAGLVILLILINLVFASAGAAVPDEAYDIPKVVAVEPRAFNPHYDLTAQISVLPMDAFYKGLAFGVSYTHTFNSSWGWEVINANYTSKVDTNLKQDLVDNFRVRPQGILDNIQLYALTNAVYTPLYSKNLFLNRDLLYGSFSLVLGGGVASFASGDTAPMVGGGLILRAFHSPRISSKLDSRLYYHLAENKSSDMVLIVTYGLSFELGDNKPWF